ncbi:polyphosphate kinase 1 [Opitutus sp. ER46]|uniref:polyphosphate kinase 1 n=1 Tax=Opitutus sp. ER46 TaxID=2161864 RepID=UPI000D31FADC|nr:polyphosphate kinase 1 [Opitutus sp. ER46]PTX97950.1 polyphosphate kinase 1 [Opitutus sp. ER46]
MATRPSSRSPRRVHRTPAKSRRSAAASPAPELPAHPTSPVYFNRELSWLAFNRRVLEQAQSERHPLLERVRFLAIVSNNLDEFFEIRVAGLIQQTESGIMEPGPDGLDPREQLQRIRALVDALLEDLYRCWRNQLMPALEAQGIQFRTGGDLSARELAWARAYFQEQIYPVLTPLALDQAHPFPQIGNKTLNVIVSLENPTARPPTVSVALLPVPRILPQLIPLPATRRGPLRVIFISEIIKLHAGELFPGYRVRGAYTFRITRNSDLYIDEEEAANLLKKIEEELRNLRRGAAVRLEVEEHMDPFLFDTLCSHLELPREYAFRIKGPLSPLRLQSLADIDRPDLKYPPFTPVNISPLRDPTRIFETLRATDVLLHHPYDSFAPVVDFVEQAARDPKVVAIKQTFYRTSGDSPLVRALIEASQNGKQVTALVELKARFDEANNIQWARQLEEAGVHVVYGLVGHKTHCKMCLIVRREGRKMMHYVHLGTGNYNPRTARIYTDLSFFTARSHLTRDVARVFNTLTGFGRSPHFRHLLVAPFDLHTRLNRFIARESRNAAAGRPARIIAKMNSLVDPETINALYKASQAGVEIDLIVRGTCCLVPGIPHLSEHIRVRSIVGRFLEHARAFYFENHGGEPLILAGSADWMPRNFFRRVEVLFPLEDPRLRRWVVEELLLTELRDTANARILLANGSYVAPSRAPNAKPLSAHAHFMASALGRARA